MTAMHRLLTHLQSMMLACVAGRSKPTSPHTVQHLILLLSVAPQVVAYKLVHPVASLQRSDLIQLLP